MPKFQKQLQETMKKLLSAHRLMWRNGSELMTGRSLGIPGLLMHKYLQMVQLLRGFPTLPYTECTYILLFNDGRPVVEAGRDEKGSFAHLQALGHKHVVARSQKKEA